MVFAVGIMVKAASRYGTMVTVRVAGRVTTTVLIMI